MGNQLWRLILILILFSTGILMSGCASQPHRSKNTLAPRPHYRTTTRLMWPVTRHKITQSFKYASTGQPHDGIDISVPKGTRIYAPADGRVTYAGQKFRGYGKLIVINHSPRVATLYGHCHKLFVKEGDAIKKGNLIALVGNTGRASAPHLHFEVRLDRAPVNPLVYLR